MRGKKKAWLVCRIWFAKSYSKHLFFAHKCNVHLAVPATESPRTTGFEHGDVPPSSLQHHCWFRESGTTFPVHTNPSLEALGIRLLLSPSNRNLLTSDFKGLPSYLWWWRELLNNATWDGHLLTYDTYPSKGAAIKPLFSSTQCQTSTWENRWKREEALTSSREAIIHDFFLGAT